MSDHEQNQIAAAAAQVVEFALTGAKTYSTLRDNFKEGEIYTTDQNGWDNYFSTATHPTRPDVLLFSLADDDFKAAKLEAINPPSKEDRVTSRSGRADANGEIDTGNDLSGADLELGGKKGTISIITNGKAEEFKASEPVKEATVGDSGMGDDLGPGADGDLGNDESGQEGGEDGGEGPGTDTAQDPTPDAPAAPAKAKVVTPAKGKTLTPGKGGKSVTV